MFGYGPTFGLEKQHSVFDQADTQFITLHRKISFSKSLAAFLSYGLLHKQATRSEVELGDPLAFWAGLMAQSASQSHYAALAEFHGQLHRCLMTSESRARQVGLQLLEYQVLLAVKAHGTGDAPTLGTLAAKLQTDRGTVGELVDNLAGRGFVRRERDKADRRRVLISLTPAGESWLVSLSDDVLDNLAKSGLGLFKALRVVLAHAATNTVREQVPPQSDLEVQAWRPMAPSAI